MMKRSSKMLNHFWALGLIPAALYLYLKKLPEAVTNMAAKCFDLP